MIRPVFLWAVVLAAGCGPSRAWAIPPVPSPEAGSPSTAPADISQLRDITGIEKTPSPPDRSWSPWLWLGLVFVPGILLVCWKLGWRQSPPTPAPPADRWALAELERVEALGLPARGEVERYHRLVSDVLRRYLELRFQLPASQQTTPEFLQTVSAAGLLTAPQQQVLSAFLERCDLAKFARAGYSAEECQAVARMARELVEQTAGPTPAAPE